MQSNVRISSKFAWGIALAASLIVLVSAVAGPRHAFASLCHQLAARSFTYNDHLFAVCHRCLGVYVGLFAGLLFGGSSSTILAFTRKWGLPMIAMAATLVTLDAGLDVIGALSNTVVTRVTTGFVLGLSGGLFLALVTRNQVFNTQPP